jgi:hypothetical protein
MPRPGSAAIDLSYGFVHSGILLERFTGTGAYGDTYAEAVSLVGLVEDGQRLIVGPNGDQITSTATVYLPAGTAAIPLQSRVTLPAEFASRVTQVVAVANYDVGSLPLPEFLEVSLL